MIDFGKRLNNDIELDSIKAVSGLYNEVYGLIPDTVYINQLPENFITIFETFLKDRSKKFEKADRSYTKKEGKKKIKTHASFVFYNINEDQLFCYISRVKDSNDRFESMLCMYGDKDWGFYKEIFDFSTKLVKLPKKPRPIPAKDKIFFIIKEGMGLKLKETTIDKTKPEIFKNSYNDDLLADEEKLVEDIQSKNKRGIIMFNGKPGTGKSYFIRHLATRMKYNKFVYIPHNILANISSPDMMSFFLDERLRNSVLIIEDAEKVMQSRDETIHNYTSELLNLSDGLLTDILGIKFICTFNCDANIIDKAFFRPGRLLYQYEFDEITQEKAQNLSNLLGYDTTIDKPSLLCDIYNQGKEFNIGKKKKKMGF
jgi:hypothetical protein